MSVGSEGARGELPKLPLVSPPNLRRGMIEGENCAIVVVVRLRRVPKGSMSSPFTPGFVEGDPGLGLDESGTGFPFLANWLFDFHVPASDTKANPTSISSLVENLQLWCRQKERATSIRV